MTVEKIKIAPGAELSVMPTDKFKTNYFALNFYIPLDKKIASEVSLLSSVMSRGTADHPTTGELNIYTDMLYELNFSMSISAAGSAQILCFRMDYLGDRYTPAGEKESISEGAMNFLREFFLRPLVKDGAFCEEYVELSKKRLSDRIKGMINNKDAYAMIRARRLFLGDHAAAIPPEGDLETVASLDGAMLYQRFLTILKESRVEALFVGDVSDGTVDGIVSALRDILPADRLDAAMPVTEPFVSADSDVREIREEADAKQSRMVLAYAVPYNGTQSHVASVFLEIFSGSPVSRLFMNVREKLNLCYYCSAGLDVSVGSMMIRSGISEKNIPAAREEITGQLNDLVNGNISDEELDMAKRAIVSSMKGLKDSSSALGEWYLRRIALGAPSDVDEMMENVEKVTLPEVSAFAAKATLKMAYLLCGEEV